MIFGPKTLYTTNEILDSILSTGDIKDTTGAVSITKKDGRKTVATGKIFFRNELIYAVEIANHEIPIGKRVESGGLVDQDDLEGIFRRLGSKSSPRIVDQLLVGQLISEKNLNSYVKEHFIETLGEILSWDNCSGEWHPNVTTNDFVMPHVSLDKIRAILENRAVLKKDFSVAVRSFFKQNEIDRLTFISNTQNHADFPAEIRALLRRADGEFTVGDIARDTGISNFAVFQSIISLWKKGLLTLRLGGIDLPFASLQQAVQPATEEAQTTAEESFVPLASEDQQVGENAIDPEEESIKEAEEVTKEFVNNTDEYVDEPEESTTSEEPADDTDGFITAESVSEEDESVSEVSSTEENFDYAPLEEETDVDDFITGDDIANAPVIDEADDEFIVSEEDSDVFSKEEPNVISASINDVEQVSEEEFHFAPHFNNLPAPIHSFRHPEFIIEPVEETQVEENDVSAEEFSETVSEDVSATPSVEPEETPAAEEPAMEEPTVEEPAVEVTSEPVVNNKKEESVPTPANLSETTLTIATFTQRLNELQVHLAEIASSVTDAKTDLDAREDSLHDAERNLREAQLAVESAQVDYEAAQAKVEETEEKYSTTVSDIETLIQSFKFNP